MLTFGFTPAPPHPRTPAPNLAGSNNPRHTNLCTVLIIALTVARWLLPTEATAEGEKRYGLRVCGSSSGPSGGDFRAEERLVRWDWADLAVGLLIGGHVLSGLIILGSGGDRRAAINVSWEWLSLGVFWFAWRELLTRIEIRRQVPPLLMTTAVTLAVWGLWQYFVWYPQTAAEYGPLFAQIEQAEATGGDTSGLSQKLSAAGIPTEPSARRLFKNRLLESREPFGPFALANTYGGLLAAWLMLGVGAMVRDGSSRRSWATRGVALGGLLSLAVALYLTNSRTAWVGTVVAGIAGLVLWRARIANSRWLFPIAVLTGCLTGIAGLAFVLQSETIASGPLKSLEYRAEYWIGTMRMLRTSPWWGVGPGQFRDFYPAYKVPQSSEEIADPHNLILDGWCNGGLAAVAGVITLLVLLVRRLNDPRKPVPSADSFGISSIWRGAGLAGFLLAMLVPVFTTGLWDASTDRLVVFGVLWFGLSWLIPRGWGQAHPDMCEVAGLAALGLSIHLLGAGGIEMPAVAQLWLLLLAWCLTPVENFSDKEKANSRWIRPGLCAAMAIAGFVTAWRPVMIVQRELRRGDLAWTSRHDFRDAERHFHAAAKADLWSAEPMQRLAALEFSRGDLDAALAAILVAVQRVPQRAAFWRQQGQILADKAQRSRAQDDWMFAVEAYRAAAARHPTDAQLLADYAEAVSHAGIAEEAATVSRRAIAQDNLNHQRGHTDQYLEERVRQEMERLITAPTRKSDPMRE